MLILFKGFALVYTILLFEKPRTEISDRWWCYHRWMRPDGHFLLGGKMVGHAKEQEIGRTSGADWRCQPVALRYVSHPTRPERDSAAQMVQGMRDSQVSSAEQSSFLWTLHTHQRYRIFLNKHEYHVNTLSMLIVRTHRFWYRFCSCFQLDGQVYHGQELQ